MLAGVVWRNNSSAGWNIVRTRSRRVRRTEHLFDNLMPCRHMVDDVTLSGMVWIRANWPANPVARFVVWTG